MSRRPDSFTCLFLLTAFLLFHVSASALLPFPLTAGQRGIVTCLDNPSVSYDIYLPPGYTTNGTARPIVYTFSPNGGGYINQYQNVCANLQMIAVGIIGFKNGTNYNLSLQEVHAVTRDIRQRVLFEATAEIMSGFSGGGAMSYYAARFRPQHVAAVYDMAGTMGRGLNGRPPTDQVQTNLLVARSWGNADAPANFYASADSNYLASCGAFVKDWIFAGVHQSSPDNIKTLAFQWILSQRKGKTSDRVASVLQMGTWKTRLANGETQAVMAEAISDLMNQPRTWFAYQGQLILDELTASGEFRSLDFSNFAQGSFAYSQFYFSAYGAALNNDWTTYHASLKALTGITGNRAERTAVLSHMLNTYGFTAPVLECTADSGQINFRFVKNAPDIIYSVQSRTNLMEDVWRDEAIAAVETDTTWSSENLAPASVNKFYRIKAVPAPSAEPSWP